MNWDWVNVNMTCEPSNDSGNAGESGNLSKDLALSMTPVMTIALAPDSFKGALTAAEVVEAMAEGLREALPDVIIRRIPMADGGEGTLDAWAAATQATLLRRRVSDPLGRPRMARLAWNATTQTALIETATVAGLELLRYEERNPLVTTTAGVGQLMRKALDLGARRILIGLGGSATNDGGTGMAAALGAVFLDGRGNPLPPGGGALARLARIDLSGFDPRIAVTRVEAACDVTNPLYGLRGAARVYAPQKGADAAAVRRLEAGLRQLARVRRGQAAIDPTHSPGAGAAGGLGYGLMSFCKAKLLPGVALLAESVGLKNRLRGCDLAITGEGRMDAQTAMGKTPVGVAAIAHDLGVPVIALCGCVGRGYDSLHDLGIEAIFPVDYNRFDPLQPRHGAFERVRASAREIGGLLRLSWKRLVA